MNRFAAAFCLLALAPFAQLFAFQGGPDGFGYYWESTQDPGDTIAFFWLDPSDHEVLTGWQPNPDDGWRRVGLPYRFPFYGDTLDSIVICSNGFLEHPSTFTSYENLELPCSQFQSLLAAFWDDLSPAQSGSVRRRDDPSARFTCITWDNVVRFNTNETLSCQMLLFASGDIRFNLLRAPRTKSSCTIGIQGRHGSDNHYLSYLFDGEPSHHVADDSMSVRFYVRRLDHDVAALRVTSPDAWLPASFQTPVSGTVRNLGSSVENFPVYCRVVHARWPYDTVFSRTKAVTALEPGQSRDCYFGDWLTPPAPDSWHVILKTGLASDQQPRNDTLRFATSSFAPGLGTILGSWSFPALGEGLNLAGITYCPDSNRFYVSLCDPNRVASFPADSAQQLRVETFELQDFFGDDMVWGIAWDRSRPGFWLVHVSRYGTGCILAGYEADGGFSGDTWDLVPIEPDVWFAGIDQSGLGTLFATAVGGTNRIYEFDVEGRRVARFVPGSNMSWRACSFLGDHNSYLFSGGWNHNQVSSLTIDGRVTASAPLADLADLDIYTPVVPRPESLVWAYATTNSPDNTIHRIALGLTWAGVGIVEGEKPFDAGPELRVSPTVLVSGQPVRVLPSGPIALWDASGRLVLRRPCARTLDTRGLAPGVYVLTVATQGANLSRRLVVAR